MPIDPELQKELDKRGLSVGPSPQSSGLFDELKKRGLSVDKAKDEEKPGVGAALWEGLKRGAKDVLESGAALGAKMMTAGPEAGAGAFDNPAQRQAAAAAVGPALQQSAQAYQQSPARIAHPLAAGAGRIGGNVAASLPLSMIPGAGGAGMGLAGRAALGAGMGAATGGGAGAIAGGLTGGLGAAIGPSLSRGFQAIASNPKLKNLAEMALGAYGRTEESFQRATANEVLQDIGQTLPSNVKVGEGLINHVHDAVDDRYNELLPKVTFRANEPDLETGATFTSGLPAIAANVPEAHQKNFNNIIKKVTGKLDEGGTMTGRDWKSADHEINREVKYYNKFNKSGDDDKYVDALRDLQGSMRDTLALSNPQEAPMLRAADASWHKLALMEDAAGRRIDSNSTFRPNDLLIVGRKEQGNRRFAQGKGVFTAFGRAGNDLIGGRQPQFDKYLADLMGAGVGGAVGAQMGGLVGGGIGSAVGAGAAHVAQSALSPLARGRQMPGAREFGQAVGRAAPVAGVNDDDRHVSPIGP